MKRLSKFAYAGLGLVALAVSGCAGQLPEAGRLPAERDAFKASNERFNQDGGDVPIRRVRTPGSGLSEVRMHQPVDAALRRRPIRVQFASSDATLDDLVQALSANDIQIGFNWTREGGGGGGSGGTSSSGGGSSTASLVSQAPQTRQQANMNTAAQAFAAPSSGGARSGGGGGGGQDAILKKRLPFMNYKGTVGGLLDTLRAGIGLVSYQEGSTVFLAEYEQYAITLPQNEDVMKAIGGTVKDMGGIDIVSSVDGGRIMYSAKQDTHDRSIGPFLRRAARNLATIKIQVAIVTLSLNDKSGQGFDWSAFSTVLDQRQAALANANNSLSATNSSATAATGTAATTGTTATTTSNTLTSSTGTTGPSAILPTTNLNQKGGLIDATSGTLTLGTTNVGKIFGVASVGSVSGAIQYLSTFGNTNVTQHVDVSALSGKEVKFSSGETIPYVKSVGVGAVGNSSSASNSTLGTAQTDTVKTGIDVSMTPRFESENELVTVDFKMKLASLIEFVQLNAGTQLGTLSQPHTADQELNDIIRIRAGQTIVLGGLQFDNEAYNGNDLTAMRDAERAAQASSGLRAQNIQRSALFVIMRPTVLVYEPEEGK